jgi:1,4-dihydroxy-2-naphthoate octaprenyltransferase
MEHEIGIWFLLLGLVFPRIVLFFWWISGNLPFNTTPLIADLICAVLLPRILILVYIYENQEFSTWFWIHMAVMLFSWAVAVLKYRNIKE